MSFAVSLLGFRFRALIVQKSAAQVVEWMDPAKLIGRIRARILDGKDTKPAVFANRNSLQNCVSRLFGVGGPPRHAAFDAIRFKSEDGDFLKKV